MTEPHAANRREDLRLITGRGRYARTANLPGQLHAVFPPALRPRARESWRSMPGRRSNAAAWCWYTPAMRFAASYAVPSLMTFTGQDGAAMKTQRPVLAANRVRFVGETVAMVVAESTSRHDALAPYRDRDPRSPRWSPPDALRRGRCRTSNVPATLCLNGKAVTQRHGRKRHTRRVSSPSPRVVTSCRAARASSYDAAAGSYDIYSPSRESTCAGSFRCSPAC